MCIDKIKIYPEITSIVIEGDKVKSLVQEYSNLEKIKVHIQECIKTVKKYEAMGYYNLAKPEFVDDVITTFTNLELSKKDVIRVNNFVKIMGFPECNRIWQLPDEIKVQASNMLNGFYISYDNDNWENFSIELIDG